jgi:hypothetical protein
MSSYSLRGRNIISGLHASSLQYLTLSDELWASSVTLEPFHPDLESIIVALQSNRSLKTIGISGGILRAIGESDQGRLFRTLGNMPTLRHMSLYGGGVSPKTLPARVLADTFSETSNGLVTLKISSFKIGSRSEVEQLARGLKARIGSLKTLTLEGIVLDVEDKTGFLDPILLALAHVDDKTGFLDPILLALAPVPGEPTGKLSCFACRCVEAALNGVSVVSPEAVGAFFANQPISMPSPTLLQLHKLGLNVNHCAVMAQALARDDAVLRPIAILDLTGNPSIGQQGYQALLGLLNRRFDILRVVVVDDENWQSTFEMVLYMNRHYHRGRFLENGVFPSKAMWVNFLAKISNSYCRYGNEAQTLNAIWYTLREDPDLICT